MAHRWRPRLGLALGGGAARGLAHLGVLAALEEEGLPVAAVAGTSIGSLVGGVWAATGSAREAAERIVGFIESDEYRRGEIEFLAGDTGDTGWTDRASALIRKGIVYGWGLFREAFVSEDAWRHNLAHLVPDVPIESLRVPYVAVATELRSGAPAWFRRGSLREAVAASSAVPGLAPPVAGEEVFLVDGGAVEKVPVRAACSLPVDVVLAVDVAEDFSPDPPLRRGTEILSRAQEVAERAQRTALACLADVLVRPEVGDIHWLDFSGARPAIARGAAALRDSLPALRAALRRARWRRFLGLTRPALVRRLERRGMLGVAPLPMEASAPRRKE